MTTSVAHLLRIGAVGLALSYGPLAAGQENRLGLPAEFAGYRQWAQLLKSPYQVPMELWILCRPLTAADWASKREKYGPHTERFIRVYGNQIALTAVSGRERRAFPPGAVIVKEKLSGSPHGTPEGVALMIKRDESRFPKTTGWEFLYFPRSGDALRTHEACASCHRTAPDDFVFGRYPR
jgi:hypothetical protein